MFVEDGGDLWHQERREDESLTVVLGPAVEHPHPRAREVHTMRLSGLKMQVLEDVLQSTKVKYTVQCLRAHNENHFLIQSTDQNAI